MAANLNGARADAILRDPAASVWLKRALQDALRRDPVDAENDAAILAEVLRDRANLVLSQLAES